MATTTEYALDESWTLVATGVTTVAVQFARFGRCEIHIGNDAPDEDSAGLMIATNWEGMPSSFSAGNLPDTASVWLRSQDGSTVVVLAY